MQAALARVSGGRFASGPETTTGYRLPTLPGWTGQPPGSVAKAGLSEGVFEERFRVASGGNQHHFLSVKDQHAAFQAMHGNLFGAIYRDQIPGVDHPELDADRQA